MGHLEQFPRITHPKRSCTLYSVPGYPCCKCASIEEEPTDEIHLSVSLGEKSMHVTSRAAPALQSADTERQRAVPQILLRAIEVG
jgi:hypothetical protein